jgi:peroxiredoxin
VPSETTAPQRAENALDFTVTDTDGNQVKLSDFTGKPVVLNFWATWCNPCTSELPEFEAAAKANPNIQFMMINATDGRDETPEKVMEFIEKNGYTFDVYYDHSLTVVNVLALQGFPTTFFIDAQGVVVNSYLGMMDAETLEQGLDMIR